MQPVSMECFPGLALGDKRRNNRLVTIINNVSRQPGSSIPRQNEGWYPTKATYSFFANKKIKVKSIEKAVELYGVKQVQQEKQLLIVHDSTYISYGDLQCEGLGYLTFDNVRGVVCLNALALSLQGWPLALLRQHIWTHKQKPELTRSQLKQRPYEEKESYEWFKDIKQCNEMLDGEVQKIHICDCEGDVYELFFFAYQPNTQLLIRSAQNRNILDHEAYLWDHIGGLEPMGEVELSIPDPKGRKRVPIRAQVRYEQVQIQRPQACKSPRESVQLWAIRVTQSSDREAWQEEPIDWKLLTNIEIQGAEEVLQCVRWYSFRWLVERFHYVMKSGTGMEHLQLHKVSSLQKAIHAYSIAAMQIMKALYLSRQQPEISCEVVLTKTQWVVLYILVHKTSALPAEPPPLGEAVQWIGRLGGYLGRKGDGPVGLKTFWLGYQRVMDAANVVDTIIQENLGKG